MIPWACKPAEAILLPFLRRCVITACILLLVEGNDLIKISTCSFTYLSSHMRTLSRFETHPAIKAKETWRLDYHWESPNIYRGVGRSRSFLLRGIPRKRLWMSYQVVSWNFALY